MRPRPAQAAPREGGRAERTAHTHLGAVAARRRRCSRSRGVYSGMGGERPSFGRRTPPSPPSQALRGTRATNAFCRQGARSARRARPLVPKAPGDLRQVGSGSRSPHCQRGRRSHMLCIRLHIIHFNVNLRKSPQPLPLLVRVLLSLLPLSLLPTLFTHFSSRRLAFLWLVHLSKLCTSFPCLPRVTLCFFESKERPRVTVCRDKGPELQISGALIFISLDTNLHVKDKNLALCPPQTPFLSRLAIIVCLSLVGGSSRGFTSAFLESVPAPPSWGGILVSWISLCGGCPLILV